MTFPKVTAVIPCWNHGEFVSEALKSVRAQTVPPLTSIIVDDGSDVSTSRVLQKLSHLPDVELVRIEHDGPGAARNAGLALVKTDFTLFLDADDFLEPTFTAECLQVLNADPRTAAASTWIKTFGLLERDLHPRGGGAAAFVRQNECASMMLVRTLNARQVGGFSASCDFEDWDFFLRLVERGWTIRVIPSFLAHYRIARRSRNRVGEASRSGGVQQLIELHEPLFARHVVEAVVAREEALARARSLTEADKVPIFGDGSLSHSLDRWL